MCRPDAELLERLTSVQQQREQHREQLARWQQKLRSAAQLVKQSENTLSQLQVGNYATPAAGCILKKKIFKHNGAFLTPWLN